MKTVMSLLVLYMAGNSQMAEEISPSQQLCSTQLYGWKIVNFKQYETVHYKIFTFHHEATG
jgi:hypothetical protein